MYRGHLDVRNIIFNAITENIENLSAPYNVTYPAEKSARL